MAKTAKPIPGTLPKQHHSMSLEIVRESRELRAAAGDQAAVTEEVYDVVVSTETPIESPFGFEVLSHQRSAIDLRYAKRGLPVYLEHGLSYSMPDPEYLVGRVTEIVLDTEAKKQRGKLRFTSTPRALQAKTMVDDGTLVDGSVGWFPRKYRREANVDPAGPETTLWTRWIPSEFGLVGIPADINAGFGRNAAGAEEFPVESESGEPAKEEQTMKRVRNEQNAVIEVEDSDPRPAITEAAAAGQDRSARSAADPGRDLRAEAREITRICRSQGLSEAETEVYLDSGKEPRDVSHAIFLKRATRSGGGAPPSSEQIDEMPENDFARYDLGRMVRMATEIREGANTRFDGLEAEVEAELAKDQPAKHGGHLVPLRALRNIGAERRGRAAPMGIGIQHGGAEFAQTQVHDFIEYLRPAAMCVSLGAEVITGCVGTQVWPKFTGDPIVRFMAQNPPAGAADSAISTGVAVGSPKTMIGTVPFPRQILNATGFDFSSRIQRVFATAHGLALDLKGMFGTGTDGEPTGIWYTPGVQSLAMGGVPSYKKLVKMSGLCEDLNAVGMSFGYMTTPLMRAELAATLKADGVPGFIWEGTSQAGTVAGYPARATTQVPRTLVGGAEHGLIFGPWDLLMFLLWGSGVEFLVDPLTLATSGQIRITTYQEGDVVNQAPTLFVKGTGATVTA